MSIRNPARALLAGAALAASLATAAQATTFTFNTNPFAGTAAVAGDGVRQVVPAAGQELFIDNFDLQNDIILVDADVFDIQTPLVSASGLDTDIPTSGVNVIALQNLDDRNAANGVGMAAPLAANLIADRINVSGAGFFFYFNTALNTVRLVYSPDLNTNTSDLRVLARFTNLTGQAGINALQNLGPQIRLLDESAAPEPATWAMMLAGFGALGGMLRLQRRGAQTLA